MKYLKPDANLQECLTYRPLSRKFKIFMRAWQSKTIDPAGESTLKISKKAKFESIVRYNSGAISSLFLKEQTLKLYLFTNFKVLFPAGSIVLLNQAYIKILNFRDNGELQFTTQVSCIDNGRQRHGQISTARNGGHCHPGYAGEKCAGE